MNVDQLPSALTSFSSMENIIGRRKIGFFLDFDGTLAPITSHPDLADLPAESRPILENLQQRHLVCVLSGRSLPDLKRRVGLSGLFYAGDHGYRISGPPGSGLDLRLGDEFRNDLESAGRRLRDALGSTHGVVLEMKELSLSVHYRLAGMKDEALIGKVVKEVAAGYPSLRVTAGKCVHELRPKLDWGKGDALLWIVSHLGCSREELCPVVIGDDLTDEDMFEAAAGWGVCVIVGAARRPTSAAFRLINTEEVADFLTTTGRMIRVEAAGGNPRENERS